MEERIIYKIDENQKRNHKKKKLRPIIIFLYFLFSFEEK
jgi:hypothetical protein